MLRWFLYVTWIVYSCDYAAGCPSTATETESTITSTNTVQGHAQQSSLWVYIIVIAILVILTLTGIFIRLGYFQSCVGRFRRLKHTVTITDTVQVRDSDPPTSRPHSDGNEEDVYYEIRESMMIENVEVRKLNVCKVAVNQRMPMFSRTYATITENTYNRLRFNQSLPNICEQNEYSHGVKPAIMGNKLSQSENCLFDARNGKFFQNESNATPSDQCHEQCRSKVYGQIWEHNDPLA